MAFQHAVVKHEVNKVPVVADEQPFLACFEAKAVAEFKQKGL